MRDGWGGEGRGGQGVGGVRWGKGLGKGPVGRQTYIRDQFGGMVVRGEVERRCGKHGSVFDSRSDKGEWARRGGDRRREG